ncbi:hypothetical protein CR194_13550 [Salipaludibacillus keqinensis]|uniref:2,4-diaminopentanoate dehydrogenase C-terminal domain-containing protein n=1 Tax=Salipaludibacillus keqinensis TaxID=2045207 RepID=A0A323TC17_9BACI|nr:hypothetical protein [Salipaludibacillus keqinensis]PYZ92681.1 hypothetical protein CR194_13550 [Salipaludibacillus keqinensis]
MKSVNEVRVLQFGLGPIGLEVVKKMKEIHQLNVIGGVDIDPDKVEKDLGELIGSGNMGEEVVSSLNDLPTSAKEEGNKVAIHCTGSNLEKMWPQIKELLDHGFSVVSTCEELSYPWHRYPELSKEIDAYAKEKGLAVLGTGVNPGFIMDTMTLCLTAVTNSVSDIKVQRNVDVSKRRVPLQKKVGVGMTTAEFEVLASKNQIGHVGLEESARLIAYGLEIELDKVTNNIKPTIAVEDLHLALGDFKKGDVSGQHQIVKGHATDGRTITLELIMSAGVTQEDRIILEGEEKLELVIPGGIFGDTATAAMAINMAKLVGKNHIEGLVTMADIPLPRNPFAPAGARTESAATIS